MTKLVQLLVAIAIGFAVSAMSVFGFNDRHILTLAPETQVEDFLKEFSVRRYPQALDHVTKEVAKTLSVDSLSLIHRGIGEQLGGFSVGEVERTWMSGNRAVATGQLRGDNGEQLSVALPLLRISAQWWVSDTRALAELAR